MLSLLEAESGGQSQQETVYHTWQSLQEARDCARDCGQSGMKPYMADTLSRKQKLADYFIPCALSSSSVMKDSECRPSSVYRIVVCIVI